MANNNLDMSTSLRCFALLLIIVNVHVCGKVKVKITNKSTAKPIKEEEVESNPNNIKGNDSSDFFKFEITYGTSTTYRDINNPPTELGQKCLVPGERLLLEIPNFDKHLLSSGFQVALDSGKYDKKESYEEELDFKDHTEMCLLYGSWIPAKGKQKEAEFYFNILTGNTNLENRSMFRFDLSVLDFELKIDISIVWLFLVNPKLTDLPHAFPDVLTKYKTQNDKEKVIILREKTFTPKGNGKFSMIILSNESENEKAEIQKDLNDYKELCKEERFVCYIYHLGEKYPGLIETTTGLEFKKEIKDQLVI